MLGVFWRVYILFDWLVVGFFVSLFPFFFFSPPGCRHPGIPRFSFLILLPLFCCWFWWLVNSSMVRQSPGELLRPHSPRTLTRGEDKQASSTFYFHLEPVKSARTYLVWSFGFSRQAVLFLTQSCISKPGNLYQEGTYFLICK